MGWRGAIDVWGNDHYLGHIHRVMNFFTRPTQTAILGDHMSSQWIDDVEFFKRSKRLEERVLKWHKGHQVFNITGNHDVGYAGDLTAHRLNRWRVRFGEPNSISLLDTEASAPGSRPVRVIVLNNLHLDGPALDEDLRKTTHHFLQRVPKDGTTTILLTHIPLHKEAGLCVDGPYVSYYDQPHSLLREQNHLSPESSKAVLDQIYDTADGVVLTGHDHQGCHTMHSQALEKANPWTASRFSRHNFNLAKQSKVKVIEEVTVRSVMGQYSGNSGVLTGVYNSRNRTWHFAYQAIPFIHNTGWWIVHVTRIVVTIWFTGYFLMLKTRPGRSLCSDVRKAASRRPTRVKLRLG